MIQASVFCKMSGPTACYQHAAGPHHLPSCCEDRHMATQHPITPGVRFKDIYGFPGYCVGDDGSVWSTRIGHSPRVRPWRKIVGRRCSPSGHLGVTLFSPDGKRHFRYVHRLVLEVFVGPCPPGMECCHDPDSNPTNNRLDNLRWDTRGANNRDAIRNGGRKYLKGERMPNAKLTDADVLEIRRLGALRIPQTLITRQFGLGAGTVNKIIHRKSWKHLPPA